MGCASILFALSVVTLLDGSCAFTFHRAKTASNHYRLSGTTDESSVEDDDDVSMEAFQARKRQQEEAKQEKQIDEVFDGYYLRDVIFEKGGLCYDVEFNIVDNFGFRQLYLHIMPFHLGGRPFRHETELDYLCHLQAVVEILEKYDQVGSFWLEYSHNRDKGKCSQPFCRLRLDLFLFKLMKQKRNHERERARSLQCHFA
jgi:hypothetical protein